MQAWQTQPVQHVSLHLYYFPQYIHVYTHRHSSSFTSSLFFGLSQLFFVLANELLVPEAFSLFLHLLAQVGPAYDNVMQPAKMLSVFSLSVHFTKTFSFCEPDHQQEELNKNPLIAGCNVNLHSVMSTEGKETISNSLERLWLPGIALNTIWSLFLKTWSSFKSLFLY